MATRKATPAKKTTAKKTTAPARKATPAKKTTAKRATTKRGAAKKTSSKPPHLRAVGPNDPPEETTEQTPAKPKPKSITDAAASGDARELLVAMQTRIAKAIDNPNCPPRDLAALTRRLHEITRDIEAIDAAAEEDGDGNEPVEDEEWDGEEAL